MSVDFKRLQVITQNDMHNDSTLLADTMDVASSHWTVVLTMSPHRYCNV